MENQLMIEQRKEDLRRRISVLEWDLQVVTGSDIRKRKMAELEKARVELQRLRSSLKIGG